MILTRDDILQLLNDMKHMLTPIKLDTLEDYTAYIIDVITSQDNHISKELNRSYMSSEIIQYAIDYIILSRTYERFHIAYRIINEDMHLTLNKLKFGIQYIFETMAASMSVFLDVYLLSRMFKRFVTTSETRKSYLFDSEPRNMILYVGDGHATRIREFLEIYGYPIVEEANHWLTKRINMIDVLIFIIFLNHSLLELGCKTIAYLMYVLI